MMFQSGDRERPGIRFEIKQKRFAPAKVRYSRTLNRFGEMPAGTTAILDQFLFSVMFTDVLQVGRRSVDFSPLRHGVNVVIQHSHFSPCEETGNLFFPAFYFGPPRKRNCVAPACEPARRKVGVSTPVKIGVKLSKLLRIKIKMRQPRR